MEVRVEVGTDLEPKQTTALVESCMDASVWGALGPTIELLRRTFESLGYAEFLLFAVVFFPLERLFTHRGGWRRDGLGTDLLYVLLGAFLIRAPMAVLITGMAVLASLVVPSAVSGTLQGLPLVIQFVLVVLIADFFYYWTHRTFHAVPALWQFHAVHHSSTQLDFVAAHRVHPVDQIAHKTISLFFPVVLGFSPQALVLMALTYGWQALYYHSNTKLHLGPLERLICGVRFHHWHHAHEPEAYDKNFAAQLSIWDGMFGTLHLPDRLPDHYGIDDPVPTDLPGQLAHPFRRRQVNTQTAPDTCYDTARRDS